MMVCEERSPANERILVSQTFRTCRGDSCRADDSSGEKEGIILRFIVWISPIACEKTENYLDFSFALSNTQSPSLT